MTSPTDNVNNNRGDNAHLQTPDVNSQAPASDDEQEKLLAFVTDLETIKQAVEGSMDRRLAIIADSQTPENREAQRQKIKEMLPIEWEFFEDGTARAKKQPTPAIVDSFEEFITAEVLAAQKALLTNYNAMFQELVNCHGYEKAKAIKEAIEAERQQLGKESSDG